MGWIFPCQVQFVFSEGCMKCEIIMGKMTCLIGLEPAVDSPLFSFEKHIAAKMHIQIMIKSSGSGISFVKFLLSTALLQKTSIQHRKSHGLILLKPITI